MCPIELAQRYKPFMCRIKEAIRAHLLVLFSLGSMVRFPFHSIIVNSHVSWRPYSNCETVLMQGPCLNHSSCKT
jgi:hypothetical protein